MPADDSKNEAFLSGVILAAGSSTRMGRPKQLLELEGHPLLQHVIDAAASSCLDELVLVLGHAAAEIEEAIRLPSGLSVQIVFNPDYELGQSGSLRAGIDRANPRSIAAAILLCDQPGITAALIDRVAEAFLDGGRPIARPVYGGVGSRRIPGHPVFLGRRSWPELAGLQGDEGARSLLASRPDRVLEVEIEGAPPPDLDTRAEYEAALRASRFRGKG